MERKYDRREEEEGEKRKISWEKWMISKVRRNDGKEKNGGEEERKRQYNDGKMEKARRGKRGGKKKEREVERGYVK